MMNMYGNQQQMYLRPPQAMNNGINWVQGVEGAKAWQLAPNGNVMLLDSDNDGIFYIKTSDSIGMCNLRRFKYQEITETETRNTDLSEYVKKSELQDLLNSMLGGTPNEQVVSTNEHKGSLIK